MRTHSWPVGRELWDPRSAGTPVKSMSRNDREIKLVRGQPQVVADVVRALGSSKGFIDLAVEMSKRDRKATRLAVATRGRGELLECPACRI